MAVGTVSGLNLDEEWQLISSVTASGTSITFNSLSGYKTLWLVGRRITKNSDDIIAVHFNGNTTGGDYGQYWGGGVNGKFIIQNSTATAQAATFKVYDIHKAIPHKVEVAYVPSTDPGLPSVYAVPEVITSLIVTCWSGGSYSGGTFYLYGIPA